MTVARSSSESKYLAFAKRQVPVRCNLATSGVLNFPLAELGVRIEELEITSSSGYGYPPLLERLAERLKVDPACVVTANGTAMANDLAMAAILEPGDEVLIEVLRGIVVTSHVPRDIHGQPGHESLQGIQDD